MSPASHNTSTLPAAFRGAVVAVTGSVGKSTAVRLIATVIGRRLCGVAFGNEADQTVELHECIARVEPRHDYALFELPDDQPGRVSALSAWREPWVGVVTNRYDSWDHEGRRAHRIAPATALLLDSLPTDGWAVVDGDDPAGRELEAATRARVIRVGRGGASDLVATEVQSDLSQLQFKLEGRRFRVPLGGRHLLGTVLSAIAVGRVLGVAAAEMADALETLDSSPLGAAPEITGRVTLLSDTDRRSPAAIRAALRMLREVPTAGRRIVVCGELETSGERNKCDAHRQIGAEAVTLAGADWLVAAGRYGEQLLAGAREAGLPHEKGIACRWPDEAPTVLRRLMQPGDVVLVRGAIETELDFSATRSADGPPRLAA